MFKRKKREVEVSKMLTLSTVHIKPETAEILDNEYIDIPVYKKNEYGWFIYLYISDEANRVLPNDLKIICNYAKFIGCQWLCLDRDAEIYSKLPVYNW